MATMFRVPASRSLVGRPARAVQCPRPLVSRYSDLERHEDVSRGCDCGAWRAHPPPWSWVGRAHVLLIDAGAPSNTPSTGIGGLLGNDGTTPSDFYRRAASELAAYPSISRLSATVTGIYPSRTPRWLLELDTGQNIQTDRILLAIGSTTPA